MTDFVSPVRLEQVAVQETVDEVLSGYASFKRTSEQQYAEWCQKLWRASIAWQGENRKGSFLDYAAEKTGLSRVTIWRDIRAGTALQQGVQPAQQGDLVSAATCLEHGKTPEQVNAALSDGSIGNLVAEVTTGTTRREMTVHNAQKFDQVRELLGRKYRVPAPRLERDEVLHDLFLFLDRDHPHLIQAFVQASTQEGGADV